MRIKFTSPYQAEVAVDAPLINRVFRRGEVRTVPDDVGRALLRSPNFVEVTDAPATPPSVAAPAAQQPAHDATQPDQPAQHEAPPDPHAPEPAHDAMPAAAHDQTPDAHVAIDDHTAAHSEEA